MNAIKQWVAGKQLQGGRDYQEDDFSICLLSRDENALDEARLLLVLADGMGGYAGGAVASEIAVRAFQEGFSREAAGIAQRFKAGIETANNAIKEKQHTDPELSEMGCTLVTALVVDSVLYWASVGDSILWLFRQSRLQRLNADHSMKPLLSDLVELGRMTEEEALNDPRNNQLRSAIFGREIPLIDVNANGFPLENGDLVLLASDGLETLSGQAMTEVIQAAVNDAGQIVEALLGAVAKAGVSGQDNTTLLVCRVGHGQDSLHGAMAGLSPASWENALEQQARLTRRSGVHIEPAAPAPGKSAGHSGIFTRILHALSGKSVREDQRGNGR